MDTYRERHTYTHDPYVDDTFAGVRGILDDRTVGGDNRFLDDYRLLRLKVKDDRTEAANNKFSYSKLENFDDFTQANNTSKNLPTEVEERNIILETTNKGAAWDTCESENDDVANNIIARPYKINWKDETIDIVYKIIGLRKKENSTECFKNLELSYTEIMTDYIKDYIRNPILHNSNYDAY